MKGWFITFEGGEGAGKTTVVRHVRDELESRGLPHLVLREPGGTELGDYMRAYLLDRHREGLHPRAELMMFNAARAQLVETVIRPALERGYLVLCDRFFDSTMVYQGAGRGLPLEGIRTINLLATDGLEPDLTLLLDIDPAVGIERAGRRGEMSAFDLEMMEFHQRVRAGYLDLARQCPRIRTIDAGREPAEVAAEAAQAVLELLEKTR